MTKKNNFTKDMMDITTGAILGTTAINVIGNANIPSGTFPNNTGNALRQGATGLIAVGLIGGTAKKIKKYI